MDLRVYVLSFLFLVPFYAIWYLITHRIQWPLRAHREDDPMPKDPQASEQDSVDYWAQQLHEPDVESNRALAPQMLEALVAHAIADDAEAEREPRYRYAMIYRLEDDGRKVEYTRIERRVTLVNYASRPFRVWDTVAVIKQRELGSV